MSSLKKTEFGKVKECYEDFSLPILLYIFVMSTNDKGSLIR